MKQCWDADLEKRPDIITLEKEIDKLQQLSLNTLDEQETNIISKSNNLKTKHTSSRLFTSKFHHRFENFSEPIKRMLIALRKINATTYSK